MHAHHHTTAPAGRRAKNIDVRTPLQPGQLALFEPAEPNVTYLEAVIDHGLLRTCTCCHRPLRLGMFFVNRATRDGIDYQCRDCKRMYVRLNRGVAREHAHLQPSADQSCEVCGGPGGKKGICLDHDHETGAFRGWLCSLCNAALGSAHDDPNLLRALAAYLEAHHRRAVA